MSTTSANTICCADRPRLAAWRAAKFADEELQKGGRCHENEIRRAFERANPEFRRPDNRIEQQYLRDMVANWFPQAKRTSSGFYKNVSLKPRTDPFTGKTSGMDLAAVSTKDLRQ